MLDIVQNFYQGICKETICFPKKKTHTHTPMRIKEKQKKKKENQSKCSPGILFEMIKNKIYPVLMCIRALYRFIWSYSYMYFSLSSF